MARPAEQLRSVHDLLQSLRSVATNERLASEECPGSVLTGLLGFDKDVARAVDEHVSLSIAGTSIGPAVADS
jgi:hypothetical protein